MHKSFLGILGNDEVKISNMVEEIDGEVIRGDLEIGSTQHPIVNGVPIFYQESQEGNCEEQELTNQAFSFKWGEKMTEFDDRMFDVTINFVIKRLKPLGIHNREDYKDFLRSKKMILDAGSGMGWMSSYMAQHTEGEVVSAEIGDGVFAGYEKCRALKNCHVIKADLMNLPFQDNTFDFIYSDGVLHHTPDCKAAVKALYHKLNLGGGVLVLYLQRNESGQTFLR